ncbi:unnamed protein product [Rotaria magnacalcarata]|uniref:F-box domain-containing protein n=1 Tax=Rotaria magnacalcarata TaxID=392030 RepID=A0A816ERH2_9BILA|nr:unnamed protein product [Rotaria magnacalcarata]CAF1652877.1 unnamed protein product [Rotaria magnacalcarata]CAF3948099.1 unnamed protein product [Rotaria magnacalcarata]CAF3979436.1 unnamed protein product [Rotaria magnacalcarata]CAF4031520.1 unnamed protein product [Rotaria magnacalcarata]
MLALYTRCEIRRISNLTEIVTILEQNSLVCQSDKGILIGSRAARHFLPNFREILDVDNADWDVIISSNILLKWLRLEEKLITNIEMIIPTINDLDLYVTCALSNDSKYDFAIPRSSTSYTAHLSDNTKQWIVEEPSWMPWAREENPFQKGSAKLLLILKKHMLYYPHQWEKTARDYRQLLTVTDSFTDNDTAFCDLFVQYNEKLHGKRCPPWLADYVIENWIAIQNEKFKKKFQLIRPYVEFEIDNYRLFPNIPEIALQRILHCLIDTTDFYPMQFVCKKWYTILHQETFWRDLYISRYGKYLGNVDDIKSWKMLYFVRLEGNVRDESKFEELVDATIQIRQITANDILQLREDLTHQEQLVESAILSKISYILSNSFYYHMEKTSSRFSVKLVIAGLEHVHSRSKVYLNLCIGECGESQFTDHMKVLSITCLSNNNKRQFIEICSPDLVGFGFSSYGYFRCESTLLTQSASTLCSQFPSGLLICLFIMMVHHDHRGQFIKYLRCLERHCWINRTFTSFD